MTRPAAAQHLRDLAWLRRVRDRIDREYAQLLVVEALARGARMTAGQLSRQFRLAYGESPYAYLMTRRIGFEFRNDVGSGAMRWITAGPGAALSRPAIAAMTCTDGSEESAHDAGDGREGGLDPRLDPQRKTR